MSDDLDRCPVCIRSGVGPPEGRVPIEGARIACHVCGIYGLSREAYHDYLAPYANAVARFTPLLRAVLSHRIRSAQKDDEWDFPIIDGVYIKRFLESDPKLPSIAEQCANAVRFIGDHIRSKGDRLGDLPEGFYAIIGAANHKSAVRLIAQLVQRQLLSARVGSDKWGPIEARVVDLTLDGWERYEEERRGRFSGKYGFLAMKFNDATLERLVQATIKPGIEREIGYNIVDTRDLARAGIIDNLMRQQIRDSAFVLADLTHENCGAYWEAGYAEGLDKPVIYLCERAKFEIEQSHFDTNHCTTVMWSADETDQLLAELVATIRRSLNLF